MAEMTIEEINAKLRDNKLPAREKEVLLNQAARVLRQNGGRSA